MKKVIGTLSIVFLLSIGSVVYGESMETLEAIGPLRVHPENSRYFSDGTKNPDGSLRAVYLTGSHTWNSLVDMDKSAPPAPFDFDAYLDFLQRYRHNFIRLWAWDSVAWDTRANRNLGKDFVHHCAPLAWARTGPGIALDGKPKFDLTQFNPEYFDRLRERAIAAGKRGIYVSVMLFEGWGLHHGNRNRAPAPDGWAYSSHPFHPDNNINGITGDLNGDGNVLEVHSLANPAIAPLQQAYIHKVIDTVNDLDNVLYEAANEGGEKDWDWWVVKTIHDYEKTKPKQHPVGLTGHGSERVDSMLASPSDWVSPGSQDGYRDPAPAWNENKVSLLDTDHIWGVGGDHAWVWRSFLRGHNPIFMDTYDGSTLGDRFDPKFEALRLNLGYTRDYANKMNLAAMTPQSELASTRFCLANPGHEYLVYLPDGGEVTIDLAPSSALFAIEWFSPLTGNAIDGSTVSGGSQRTLKPPDEGDWVLYLRREQKTSNRLGQPANREKHDELNSRPFLTVGVVQLAREQELGANRDKIVSFITQAKTRGCRLAVFPEDALGSPEGTSNEEIEKAVDTIRDAARAHDIYVIFCSPFAIPGFAPDKRGHCLYVVDPTGRIIHQYNKLICNIPPSDPRRAPGLFYVDEIPCSAMICADRWLRGIEELPVILGSKILIDCSANSKSEWIPEFAWYLPVTRALRNNVYSIFCNMGENPKGVDIPRHGHSAVIHPDGTLAAAADAAGDQMLVATLDLSKADGAEAKRRHNHPVLKSYWDLGKQILAVDAVDITLPKPFDSPQTEITIAAAQMACSRDIATNIARMARFIGEAANKGADVVVFPELAVTGAMAGDIRDANAASLHDALTKIQSEAERYKITVIFGMPYVEGSQCRNSAFAIGPDGRLLTRYDQTVVDRKDLFEEGADIGSMWFKVKGVPAIVTVGSDARWNEIGELAAVRGAQLHFNLSYDEDVSEAAALQRTQFWVQLASFRTFSATVNAADPQALAQPSAAANGGSAIWDDLDGHKKKPLDDVEVFSQYSASRIISAGSQEKIIYAKRSLPKSNTHQQRFIARRYPHLEPWYHLGAKIVGVDSILQSKPATDIDSQTYFPLPESQGGWRKLTNPEEIKNRAGMDSEKLDEVRQWLLNSDNRDFAAVVIRNGYIVLEVERGNSAITDSRRVASVSKAVCSTVLAIASEQSQQGLTPRRMTFADPAFDYIPWAYPLSDPRKAQITVKQLLNHTSGICPEAVGAPNDGAWEYILGHSGDERTAKLAFDPGTACGYSTHALAHAALVCETVTGKPYDQFAIEALFKPLGIEHWWFQYFDGGEKIGRHPSHGLGMPARDLARIAYCMLQNGRWGERQIIPKWFVEETASPTHNVTRPEMRWKLKPQIFSHGWELPSQLIGENTDGRRGDGIPADARAKPGSGGQYIAFAPSLNLVVTRQTGLSGSWEYEEYLRRCCAAVLE